MNDTVDPSILKSVRKTKQTCSAAFSSKVEQDLIELAKPAKEHAAMFEFR